ncbi:MAG: hypothetical protein IKP50_00195 [Bacilli bacterium]|nr:hypothetical protein [Bacilli bacterium]
MADIELVMKISEDFIDKMDSIKDDRELSREQLLTVYRGFHAMLHHGIPLPKGHGRLIDEKELKKEAIRCEWSRNMYDKLDYTLSYMKPIIEADIREVKE